LRRYMYASRSSAEKHSLTCTDYRVRRRLADGPSAAAGGVKTVADDSAAGASMGSGAASATSSSPAPPVALLKTASLIACLRKSSASGPVEDASCEPADSEGDACRIPASPLQPRLPEATPAAAADPVTPSLDAPSSVAHPTPGVRAALTCPPWLVPSTLIALSPSTPLRTAPPPARESAWASRASLEFAAAVAAAAAAAAAMAAAAAHDAQPSDSGVAWTRPAAPSRGGPPERPMPLEPLATPRTLPPQAPAPSSGPGALPTRTASAKAACGGQRSARSTAMPPQE